MKKTILLTAIAMFSMLSLNAQTFTVTNADGVEIMYTIVDDEYARVVANNYSGRVVVPPSVTYEGTTYEVKSIANRAFANCDVTYVELPETFDKMGVMAFENSPLDTLRLNCVVPPNNMYGNVLIENSIIGLFGNQRYNDVCVIVPAGTLREYRYSFWGVMPLLTSPGAVPVTMFAPKRCQLTVGNRNLKLHGEAAGYYTRFFEIGEKVWMAAYPDGADTVFLGWDKGDVYLTEIVQADTLRPVFEYIGHNTLAVNNVSTPVKFTGLLSYMNGQANYFVPANSSMSPLYANGLWMTGVDNDAWYYKVRATTYNCAGDYVPGPLTIDGQYRSDLETRRAFNRVWTVSRNEIDDFIAHVGTEGYSIPENILSWPGNGGEGYAEQLAPYYDADNDGIYNPHHGDYPLIRGDRMAFSIFNDVTVAYYTGSDPLGMEIHMSAYAFDEPQDTALNNTVFVSYKIINRTNTVYTDAYFGAFSDFDIGYGYDDYIGCDVKAGMAYAYNGLSNDNVYGGEPPAQGCILLAGPFEDSDGLDNPIIDISKMQMYYPEQLAGYQLSDGTYDTLRLNADADLYYPLAWNYPDILYDPSSDIPNSGAFINGMNYGNGIVDDERMGMCKFIVYENSTNNIIGDPTYNSDFYNYLKGRWKNSEGMFFGGNAYSSGVSPLHCSYMYPGDSDPLYWGTGRCIPDAVYHPNDWTEITAGNAPGDRRGLMSSGPFTIMPGEENTLDIAFSTAFGTYPVVKLREQAMEIRRQFAHDTTDSGRPFTYMPYSAPIVGIDNVVSQPSLRVYPNPASSTVTVALGDGRTTDVEVYDIRGNKVISRSSVLGMVHLDVSSLPRGVYFIRCGSAVNRFVKL